MVLLVKNPLASTGGVRVTGSIPESGISFGIGNGNPLQYSYLENPPGQKSLVGYRPWGCKELDRTEHTGPIDLCSKFMPTLSICSLWEMEGGSGLP